MGEKNMKLKTMLMFFICFFMIGMNYSEAGGILNGLPEDIDDALIEYDYDCCNCQAKVLYSAEKGNYMYCESCKTVQIGYTDLTKQTFSIEPAFCQTCKDAGFNKYIK